MSREFKATEEKEKKHIQTPTENVSLNRAGLAQ
jgi:hypothetical protein